MKMLLQESSMTENISLHPKNTYGLYKIHIGKTSKNKMCFAKNSQLIDLLLSIIEKTLNI